MCKVFIKTLTMDHFEDWLQDTKNRCSEEWAKKESFFLKLQQQYLEGEISKTPKPQTEAEETNLTEMLMGLADNTIVTSTPAIPRTQTNQERANNQPTQKKPKQATKHDNKQTGRRTDYQQNARDPPPHKPQIHNHPGRTRHNLPRNGFNHRNQHFVRSPSPQHRWAPDNHDFPPRPTYPIKPRYDWQPEPEMDHHSRYYAAPYIPPQYAQPSWAQPTPSRNQQQPPAQPPISSDGNQDFFISTNLEKPTSIKDDVQITVINISGVELSHSQGQLLSKSLKFNVSTDITEFTKIDFTADAELLIQKIKHKSYHSNKSKKNSDSEMPIVKNKSQRRTATTNPEILKLQDTIQETVQSCCSTTNRNDMGKGFVHNVTQSERAALQELQNNYELVIREADKGSAVVLMNTTYYCNAATTLLQSNRYKKRPDLSKDGAMRKLRSARKQIIDEFRLTLLKEEIDFLENFEESLAHLYLNPKIHKSKTIIDAVTKCRTTVLPMEQPADLPFRPIISGTRCPLKRLAALVHKLLEPFPKKVGSYVKDTWDLLRKLPQTIQPGSELISLDVKDLYTNIDNDLGFKAVEYYMDKYPELAHNRLGKNFILRSLQTLQENILYEFNGEVYSQENGCAMGKDYGPTWATLAVGYLEETKLYPQIRRNFPVKIANKFEKDYQRFQDDTLLVNEHGMNKDMILELFNNLHPQLEFTSEDSRTELPFLDVLITIEGTKIETKIYHKKTDSFNYLHFGSNHPWHTKRNIPYSLARRIRGIVSKQKDTIHSYLQLRKRLIE